MSHRVPRDYAEDWAETLSALHGMGIIGVPTRIERQVYAADVLPPYGWGDAARESVEYLGGYTVPNLDSGGLLWRCGSAFGGRIIPSGRLRHVRKVQSFCRAIMGADYDNDDQPWTSGGGAVKLLKWCAAPQVPQKAAAALLLNDEHGERPFNYHDCQPGEYPDAVQWDARSYYWQLLARLPSPRCQITSRGVLWDTLSDQEAGRWRDVLHGTKEMGLLYKSLWGCSLGPNPTRPRWKYVRVDGKGVKQHLYLPAGPFRSAALLVARTGNELCRLASEEVGSVYSTVDSVTTISGAVPRVWEQWGIGYDVRREGRREARGAADVQSLGVWQVGEVCTEHYQNGRRGHNPVPMRPVSRTAYHKLWL